MPGLGAGKVLMGLAGAGGTPTTLTFDSVTYYTDNDGDITLPTGMPVGGLMVLSYHVGYRDAYGNDPTVSDGWTLVRRESPVWNSTFYPDHCMFMKIVESGDQGKTISVQDAGGSTTLTYWTDFTLLVFSCDATITTLNVHSSNSNYSPSGNPASISITSSGATPPCVVIGSANAYTQSTGPTFATESPSFGTTYTGNLGPTQWSQSVGFTIYNSSPSNQTIDINDLGFVSTQMLACIEVS